MSRSGFGQSFDPQYQQKIEELVAIAKEQGYITYEEINEILPMSFDSADDIDQVLIFLSGMDIQIFNQSEVERHKERKKEAKETQSQRNNVAALYLQQCLPAAEREWRFLHPIVSRRG